MKALRSQGVNGELRTCGEMEGSYGVARIALVARETLEPLGVSKRVAGQDIKRQETAQLLQHFLSVDTGFISKVFHAILLEPKLSAVGHV